MNRFILFTITLLLLVSCKKDSNKIDLEEIENMLNQPPQDFGVTVLSRDNTTADLIWDEAQDMEGDSVTYTIELAEKVVARALKTRSYRLSGLAADATYNGRVIAIDSKGLKTSSNFTIIPNLEQILQGEGYYGGLNSYNAAGAQSWTVGAQVLTIPAVSNDTVFCGTRGEMLAINAKNGAVLWRKPIEQFDGSGLFYYRGKVFFNGYNKIYGLNASDGTTLWTFNQEPLRDLVVSDGILFAIDFTGMYAIDINTGTLKWKVPRTLNMSTPVAKNGILYFTCYQDLNKEGYLRALNIQTGIQQWEYKFTGGSLYVQGNGAPAVDDQHVYLPAIEGYYGPKITVHAVNIKTGISSWKRLIETYDDPSGIIADETGIYTSSRTHMFKLNKASGNILWSISADFSSTFTLAGDKIYVNVGDLDNTLTTYSAYNGQKIKSIIGAWGFFSSPVVIRNKKAYYPANKPMSSVN